MSRSVADGEEEPGQILSAASSLVVCSLSRSAADGPRELDSFLKCSLSAEPSMERDLDAVLFCTVKCLLILLS